MNESAESRQILCSAATQAGKPCRYPAIPGSDPPLCDLHSMSWLNEADHPREADYYGRYLARWKQRGVLAQMDQRSLVRELLVARASLDGLLDLLGDPQIEAADYKALLPLVIRLIKLICDLHKQLDNKGSEDHWDEVLGRLRDELDIDI